MTTAEDKPWGVAPPHWRRLGERDDVMQLYWQAPARPNGMSFHLSLAVVQAVLMSRKKSDIDCQNNLFHFQGQITHYVVLRDGQERYRGDEYSFTDVGGITPFQEYCYHLRACNRAGCTDSTQVKLPGT